MYVETIAAFHLFIFQNIFFVANVLTVFSLVFSLMTLYFDNMKFATLIWEDSEYRLVSQAFCFRFVFYFFSICYVT